MFLTSGKLRFYYHLILFKLKIMVVITGIDVKILEKKNFLTRETAMNRYRLRKARGYGPVELVQKLCTYPVLIFNSLICL